MKTKRGKCLCCSQIYTSRYIYVYIYIYVSQIIFPKQQFEGKSNNFCKFHLLSIFMFLEVPAVPHTCSLYYTIFCIIHIYRQLIQFQSHNSQLSSFLTPYIYVTEIIFKFYYENIFYLIFVINFFLLKCKRAKHFHK